MKRKKKVLTRMVAMCIAALVGIISFSTTSLAAAPTIDSSFKKLSLGEKNQLKVSDYDGSQTMAGCFKAPSSGKYSIYVVNNGELVQHAYLMDEDFANIARRTYLYQNEKYTFKTISLKKNQKVYFYATGNWSFEKGKLASRVVIKQVSRTPTISKTSLSLRKGKSYTLKMKYNSKPVIWVSSKKSVATVSSKGVVKAKKKGTAYIYAIANHKLYKCKVTVK